MEVLLVSAHQGTQQVKPRIEKSWCSATEISWSLRTPCEAWACSHKATDCLPPAGGCTKASAAASVAFCQPKALGSAWHWLYFSPARALSKFCNIPTAAPCPEPWATRLSSSFWVLYLLPSPKPMGPESAMLLHPHLPRFISILTFPCYRFFIPSFSSPSLPASLPFPLPLLSLPLHFVNCCGSAEVQSSVTC